MDIDVAFDLEQSRRINQVLALGIDCVCRVGIGDCRNGLHFLLLLAILPLVVKLDVSLKRRDRRSIIGRPLLELLLELCILFLVRGGDDTPASSPGYTSTESDSNPFFGRESCPLHDDTNVVEGLALSSDESTSIGLLQGRMLEDSKANTSSPLEQRVSGVKVKQISVSSSCGDTQDIL
jgi:hypothetical protein